MSIKARPLTGPDDPRIPKPLRRRGEDYVKTWVKGENDKWRVVATCEVCSPHHPLASFEVEPHRLTHLKTARARQIIGMLASPRTTAEELAEVRAYLA